MSNFEFPSDAELDAIEYAADAEALAVNASLGDYDENPVFDFCADCPVLKNYPRVLRQNSHMVSQWVLEASRGLYVTGRLVNKSYSRAGISDKISLGFMPGNIWTPQLEAKIVSDAAQRTRDCESPKRVPAFLGPISVRSCPAVKLVK
jgi:hypothetical protein